MTKPSMFPQANAVLKAPPGYEDVVTDLPVCKTTMDTIGNVIVSCWVVCSFWERIKFIFSGRIYVVCKGHTHPPLYIELEVFKKEIVK